jgi:hypothetical protein
MIMLILVINADLLAVVSVRPKVWNPNPENKKIPVKIPPIISSLVNPFKCRKNIINEIRDAIRKRQAEKAKGGIFSKASFTRTNVAPQIKVVIIIPATARWVFDL